MKKQMKRFQISWCLGIAVFLLAAFMVTEASAATIKVTNKTDRKVYVALMWWADGSESSSGTRGWWSVEPGKTKNLVWKGIDMAAVQVGYMGYYAQSGNLEWSGNGEITGWIHPTEGFESRGGEPIPGGEEVNFRMFETKLNADKTGAVGRITLTR